MASTLRPFWRYYGAKWRLAPLYPSPRYRLLVEPFAGAAGYALRYPDRDVVLVDRNPRVVGVWDYLIRAPESEVARIPDCRDVNDLPAWVPQEARWLIGWWLNNATVEPRKRQSAGRVRNESRGDKLEYWNRAVVERITSQQHAIRHWIALEGSYDELPNAPATWFVDPPYNNRAGSLYTFGSGGIDYAHLGAWCREREGQVIVCENEGADWLPFAPFADAPAYRTQRSREVVWLGGAMYETDPAQNAIRLWAEMEWKHAYNRTRTRRHGGKAL